MISFTPQKNKKYSAPLRLWHWVNLIVISGSLLTILANTTITKNSTIAALLKTSFKQSGVVPSDRSLQTAAQTISDSVWFIHVYFGYSLAALLIFRLILEIFQIADQKLIYRMKAGFARFMETRKNRAITGHELFVKVLYTTFYVLLITMVATGLFIGYGGNLAIYESIISVVRNVHAFGMYLILAFIIVHLVGVFIAERKRSKGIVSEMINGGSGNS